MSDERRTMRRALAATLTLTLLAGGPAMAQGSTQDSVLSAARSAFEAGRWAEAAEHLAAVVERDAGNAEAWYQLGISLRELGRYPEAVAAIESAIERGHRTPAAIASLAVTHSLAGELDRAFTRLGEAIRSGVPPRVLETHPGLAAVRADPRFPALLEEAKRAAHPCADDPRYRTLDFWLGEWDLYARGRKLGENRIESRLHGCLVVETWTDSGGAGGSSVNYYDPASGKWRQNWVGDNGTITSYEADARDGAVHFAGESHQPDGTVTPTRMTLSPSAGGGLRQVIEVSQDGGRTWTVVFDAVYVRHGDRPPEGA